MDELEFPDYKGQAYVDRALPTVVMTHSLRPICEYRS